MVSLGLATPEIFGMAKFEKPISSNVSSLVASPCGSTINWHNLSDSGCGIGQTNPGVTADVIDQNIDVRGTNALVDGVHVSAINCDIIVNVSSGDAIITGSGDRCDGVPTNPARLYLYAASGRTITFQLKDNLTFSGGKNGMVPLDLLILVTGGGNVIFDIDGGNSVDFTQLSAIHGGTRLFVGMTALTLPPSSPTLTFLHSAVNSFLKANVIVGPGSTMSYAAQFDEPTAIGSIRFQPTASENLSLIVQNGGGVIIAGHPADLTNPNLLLSDINMNQQAGADAEFIVEAVGNDACSLLPANGSITIVNENFLCPDGLMIDPFCIPQIRAPLNGYILGFILSGPSGVLTVNDQTYIAYIGTTTNTCCDFQLPDSCGILEPLQRLRNGSAMIIDAADDFSPATINLNGSSAIYFLSGVDNCGSVSPDFTVNTSVLNYCAGNILLDVEGPLDIFGSSPDETGINILSLEVDPTGCPVTIDSTAAANFPARTFNRQPDGQYVQYNLGCFLINNIMSLNNTSLIHTDTIHKVYEHWNLGNPNLSSEPTYIGSDSYLFPCHIGRPRPTIELINSKLRVHTNICSTGVDFLFPNDPDGDNNSSIIFYSNGRCVDNGYGRNMILGTNDCFDLCDIGADGNSHLNVFQIDPQESGFAINVDLLTAYNNHCITEGVTTTQSIAGQDDVQTIFLNNASNFSIGTDGSVGVDRFGNTFALTIPANVVIDGSCYSFETHGGTIGLPQESGVTGEGGIFVDALGSLSLINNRIASFGTMVTKSRGGVVSLPYNQTFFEPRIGITEWQPLLSDPVQRLLVSPTDHLSDYSFDWGALKKTYCCNSLFITPTCFIPYDTESIPAPCACPAVTQNNLVNLPTIQGEVDQLQVLRSRICDTAHLLVDGGHVRELVFLQGYNSAQAPTAFLVLQNDGLVGLGSAHKDVDSLEASIVLGVNGVMLVPNGNGNIELNEDVIINNVCHILSGTAFGQNFTTNTLKINSTTPKELRIKSTGVLDLTQFDTPFKVLELTGQVRLVCEPGARIIMNGGILKFSGSAIWCLEQVADFNVPTPVNVNSTDNVRVKLSGTGGINMIENSTMFVGIGSYFGVETYPTCSNLTNIEWLIEDQASVEIGNDQKPGGSFQIGDTVVTSTTQGITFRLELDGPGALFLLDRQGFFGLSAGVVNKPPFEVVPNAWTVSCLSNVTTCSIILTEGIFQNNQIASGFDPIASVFAIGSEGSYTFNFNTLNTLIFGGGNMFKINCTELEGGQIVPTEVIPTMTNFAGLQPGGFVQSNIMAGEFLLIDANKPAQPSGVTPQALFNYLTTPDYFAQATPRANLASDRLNIATAGYIRDGSTIRRDDLTNGTIINRNGQIVNSTNSLGIGAVAIKLNPALSDNLQTVIEIEGTGAL